MADEEPRAPGQELTLEQAIDMAVDLHNQGRLEEAVALYAQILEAAPNHGPTLLLAGACRLQQGDPEQALALMDAALSVGYETVELLHNRALAFKALGRTEEALPELMVALELAPDRPSTLFNLANTLRELGRVDEARARCEELLAIEPGHAEALVNLSGILEESGDLDAALNTARRAAETGAAMGHLRQGQVLERLERFEEAQLAFQRCLDQEPQDALGAGLHLARLRGQAPEKAPDSFVAALYDQYAGRFDDHLVEKLEYRGPELLERTLAGRIEADRRLAVLDLGCGSGLCAPVLRPYAASLVGVDLSRKMLERAARRSAYDRLVQAEAREFLGAAPDSWDIIAAMDVLLYTGDLAPITTAAAAGLEPGGLLVFTVELSRNADFELTRDMRYAHSEAHLRDCAAAAGLEIEELEHIQARQDEGRPVDGLMAVLRKAAD